MTKRYDVVFLDMGYTLVWFYPSAGELIARAWNDAGLSATPEQVQKAFMAIWSEEDKAAITSGFPPTKEYDEQAEYQRNLKVMRLLGGEDEALVHAYGARANELFLRPGAIRLYDDALPALAQLKSDGYRLGIVSNWSWNLIDRCKHVGIDGYFDVIMASAYAGNSKPHPEIFRQTLERVGVSAEIAVHVGDFYHADVVGARSAGATGILLDRKGDNQAVDCPVIQNLGELVNWLENR